MSSLICAVFWISSLFFFEVSECAPCVCFCVGIHSEKEESAACFQQPRDWCGNKNDRERGIKKKMCANKRKYVWYSCAHSLSDRSVT